MAADAIKFENLEKTIVMLGGIVQTEVSVLFWGSFKERRQFTVERSVSKIDIHVDIYSVSVCEESEHFHLCMRIKGDFLCACMITVSDWIRSSSMLVSYMIFEVIWLCLSLTEPVKITTMTFSVWFKMTHLHRRFPAALVFLRFVSSWPCTIMWSLPGLCSIWGIHSSIHCHGSSVL